MLRYCRAIEACLDGDPEVRGQDSPLDVTTDYPRHPVQQAMYDATVQEGVPENPDYNAGSVEGVGWMPEQAVPGTQPIFFSVPCTPTAPASSWRAQRTGSRCLPGSCGRRPGGSLTLSGPNPEDPVRIDLGAYTECEDLDAMLFSLR